MQGKSICTKGGGQGESHHLPTQESVNLPNSRKQKGGKGGRGEVKGLEDGGSLQVRGRAHQGNSQG